MLNAVNRVCLLSLMNPHVMLVEYEMYSRLFIFNTLEKSRMGTRLPEIGVVRLVINQSVCSCGVKSTPEDRSCYPLFAL
jgi:hypothetical protein